MVDGPLCLVFHDSHQDLKDLTSTSIQAKLDDIAPIHPDKMANDSASIFVFDTTNLFGALEGNGNNNTSLAQVCAQLQIPIGPPFHNAGNDATAGTYTLLAFKSMASGAPAQIQKATRWPSGTLPVISDDGNLSDSDYD
ncbi:hypothetical protein C8J56DRAFT_910626 [Mycena floridula]|nr:hypothetical protein C8J56DRAFT_910626 [Mycena floridula]